MLVAAAPAFAADAVGADVELNFLMPSVVGDSLIRCVTSSTKMDREPPYPGTPFDGWTGSENHA